MKKIFICQLAAFAFFSAMAQTKPNYKPTPSGPSNKAPNQNPASKANTASKPATSTLKNGLDSLSYAIGVLDASFFKQQGITTLNYTVMLEAVKAVLEGKPTKMEPQAADQVLRTQMQAAAAKKIQPTINEGSAFLAKNKLRPEVKTTASGLQYEVIKMGTGPMPKDTSMVKVHYTGTLIDGKKFESSRDGAGQPVEYQLNGFIPGWIEGLQLMPVGSLFKFYIPYNLAYGAQGNPPTIPGGAALIFEIELFDIVVKASPAVPNMGQQ